MPEPKRNVVGPADPATRRRLLAEALRPGPPVAGAKPKPKLADTSPSAFEAAVNLGNRGKMVDAATDDTDEYRRRRDELARRYGGGNGNR